MDLKSLIETLAQRMQTRGCTESEEDEAARKIGKIIMKYGIGILAKDSFSSTLTREMMDKAMRDMEERIMKPSQSRSYPFHTEEEMWAEYRRRMDELNRKKPEPFFKWTT